MVPWYSRSLLPAAVMAVLVFSVSGCDRPPPTSQPAAPTPAADTVAQADWASFVDEFIEAYFVANPGFAATQGRHEFDGKLPDWSADGIQKTVTWLEASRNKALQFTDAALSPEQRMQREYVVSRIDGELFWLRDARFPFTNPAFYFDNGLDPNTYVSVPYAPAEKRLRAFIEYARAIPNAVRQIRANLQTPLPRTFVEYGMRGFAGFAEFYRTDVVQAFAEVKDPQLQEQLRAAIEPAANAMQEMSGWIEAQRPQATEDYALGTERFAAMIRQTEGVTTPLDQLEAIGRADLERNLTALTQACKEYVPGGTVKECVARQAADKPEGGPVQEARNQLTMLRQFVIDHDIVTVPGPEQALVEEAPAYRRQNAAYINIPGPYETNLPSVYNIAPPDPTWTEAEREQYIPGKASLLFISVHEVWPGHFLQFLHSNRSSWRFGQLMVGYAFAEGWAHYTEEMMADAGLTRGKPERRVGQLLNALLRNVRFVCAIGLHTKGMTVAQCEKMFVAQAYQDVGNARQQAARGTYDPAYLNYTMGKLMIRKLRNDWLATNPGKTLRQFHDQFLSYGGPPVPLVRAQMMGQAVQPAELF